MRNVLTGMLAMFVLACTPKQQSRDVPLYQNLAGYHFKISTSSEEVQKYFDQGFVCYYGFNHEFAIASFQQALDIDSTCAMAWWGQSISVGPNINNPYMDSSAVQAAVRAVTMAKRYLNGVTDREADLITALASRYAWPPPEDRKSLDLAYAEAMRRVWQKYPDDIDVGALYVDAMLNLRPWDLWTQDGRAQKETPEIMLTLERLINLNPTHPGVNHYYIHTMEASPWPEKALPSANVLRNRIPGAGHLVHMPAHIDIRLGHYSDAVAANQRGIAADSPYVARGGFYTLYRAHNYHFLAYAAMFDGQKALSLKAAQDMLDQIPLEMVRMFPDFIDGFLAIRTHVMVRFGMWNELLEAPRPPSDLFVTGAFWRYGRTIAFSALGRTLEAGRELDSLRREVDAVPASRMIGNNPAQIVLQIGIKMAEGEYAYRRGQYTEAFALLREAVRRDDDLRYDEPWGWMMPVRHSLGALLVDRGQFTDAEAVYRRDLEIHPGNGWALHGLLTCLQAEKKETADVENMLRTSWARSDIALRASCFCSARAQN